MESQINKPWSAICGVIKQNQSKVGQIQFSFYNCMHHFHSYNLQKTLLKFVNWFQRYEQLKNAKNNRKQETSSALFGSILKSVFPTSDWFCLITSQLLKTYLVHKLHYHYHSDGPLSLKVTRYKYSYSGSQYLTKSIPPMSLSKNGTVPHQKPPHPE